MKTQKILKIALTVFVAVCWLIINALAYLDCGFTYMLFAGILTALLFGFGMIFIWEKSIFN